MKKFTLLASLLMFITMTYAVNVIPVGDAIQASKNFLSERVGAVKASQMELVLESTEYSADGTPVTYRFRNRFGQPHSGFLPGKQFQKRNRR